MTPNDLHCAISPDLKAARERYDHDRFYQLNDLLISNAQGAWEYLMFVNGGGAAATLTLLGAVQSLRIMWWPYVVLAIFTAGLCLVGIARIVMTKKADQLTHNWVKLIGRYYRLEIDWNAVIHSDDRAVKQGQTVPWIIGYSAFGAFVLGVVVSAVFLYQSRPI